MIRPGRDPEGGGVYAFDNVIYRTLTAGSGKEVNCLYFKRVLKIYQLPRSSFF